jgi:hypothetical protein
VLVDAGAAANQTGGLEEVVEGGEVARHCAEEVGGRGAGRAGDLDLATGLDGDQGAVGEREVGAVGGDGPRRVVAEGGGQTSGVERQVRLVAMVDRPLELDPDAFGWPVLEADQGDVGLRVVLVCDGPRRPGGSGRLGAVSHTATIAETMVRRKAPVRAAGVVWRGSQRGGEEDCSSKELTMN